MCHKLIACVVLVSVAVAVPAGAGMITIDDFSGSTLNSAWVPSVVVNNGTSAYTFDTTTNIGELTNTLSNFNKALQPVLLRNDYSLTAGKTVSTDVDSAKWLPYNTTTLSGGLCVAMETGITSRKDCIILTYAHGTASGSTGVTWYYFDHTGANTSGYVHDNSLVVDELYATRTGANTYDLGYSVANSADRVLLKTLTVDASNTPGSAIGYWTYLAGNGSIAFDNFRLEDVPEPSAVALLITGLIGLLAYAWKKRR